MKTYKYILSFLMVALLATGCTKQKLPPNQTDSPLFEVQAKIGTDNIYYSAGDDGLVMNTDHSNANNLNYLLGEFRNVDASKLFKVELVSDMNYTIQTILNGLEFTGYSNPIASGIVYNYSFTYKNALNINPISVLWSFGDGNTSTALNPIHSYTTSGIKTVTVISDYGFCTDTISNVIDLSPTPCQIQYNYTFDSLTNTAYFVADTGFNSYVWTFGDGGFVTAISDTVSHQYVGAGKFTAIVDATNTSTSCVASYKHNINTSTNFCGSGFLYSFNTQNMSGIDNINTAIVSYKASNGNTYSNYKQNALYNQKSQLDLAVQNFTLYNKNEKGQSTVKVTASVNGWLYNVNDYTDSLAVSTQKLVFAVAYPK